MYCHVKDNNKSNESFMFHDLFFFLSTYKYFFDKAYPFVKVWPQSRDISANNIELYILKDYTVAV